MLVAKAGTDTRPLVTPLFLVPGSTRSFTLTPSASADFSTVERREVLDLVCRASYSTSARGLTPLLVSTTGTGRSTPGGWFFRV
jgi:hypothetical protein